MKIVKDLMVPVEECGTVHQEMTLCEAIRSLKRTPNRQRAQGGVFSYSGLLVLDTDRSVVGKLDSADIVVNMDPGYRYQEGSEAIAHTSTTGLSPAMLKSLMQQNFIWKESFQQICQRVLDLKVRDCMCTPGNDTCVLESDLLEAAMHKLAIGHHQSLLVIRDEVIVGVFKLNDVFEHIARNCRDWNEQDA